MISQDNLIKTLNAGLMTIKFRKVHGELRTIECTRNLNFIPLTQHPKELQLAVKDGAHLYGIVEQSLGIDYVIHSIELTTKARMQLMSAAKQLGPLVKVYDIEVGEWRTVDYTRIISAEVL